MCIIAKMYIDIVFMSNKNTKADCVRDIFSYCYFSDITSCDSRYKSSYISVPANIGPRLNNPLCIVVGLHRHHLLKSQSGYNGRVLAGRDNLQSNHTDRLYQKAGRRMVPGCRFQCSGLCNHSKTVDK